jgi:hypothetical protein
MKSEAMNRIVLAGSCLTLLATFIAITPILTTNPNERARRHWEKDYALLLPRNYSDFQAHWQSQDVGVRIFSFRCPENMTGDEVLRRLAERLPEFKTADQQMDNEVALRRPVSYSGPGGFDEYRFIYRRKEHRVYGMFANLDSESTIHAELKKNLRKSPDDYGSRQTKKMKLWRHPTRCRLSSTSSSLLPAPRLSMARVYSYGHRCSALSMIIPGYL